LEFEEMGKFLNRIYIKYSNPGLIKLAHQKRIDFEWVIEAGCHDGSDTLKFLEIPTIKKIYAFEPDEVAADKAEDKFKTHGERVELRRMALMDLPGIIEIKSPTGAFGDGTSIVSKLNTDSKGMNSPSKYLNCSNLDSELQYLNGNGVMWLDVEGAAAHVLTGSTRVLSSVSLIQVEVEMHNSEHRKTDFVKVDRILKKSKFSLIYAPIHPGYFGDAVYLKTSYLSFIERFRSTLLTCLYLLLHKIIYPAIGKPIG
jgi:FkbM family methyltransferase